MTLELAVRIALRELEAEEGEIDRTVGFASAMAPGAGDCLINEGMERQCINAFKGLFLLQAHWPEGERKFSDCVAITLKEMREKSGIKQDPLKQQRN